jgi:hypothetical protein
MSLTSNVCHEPRPITGSFSPVEGIARVMMSLTGASFASARTGTVAASAARNPRRVHMGRTIAHEDRGSCATIRCALRVARAPRRVLDQQQRDAADHLSRRSAPATRTVSAAQQVGGRVPLLARLTAMYRADCQPDGKLAAISSSAPLTTDDCDGAYRLAGTTRGPGGHTESRSVR